METVNTIIRISGEPSSLPQPHSIHISSDMNSHHSFMIKILLSMFDNFDLKGLKKVLGQDIEIEYFGELGLSGYGIFQGAVDQMKIDYGSKGEDPHLTIKGFSKTVNMDYAPRFMAFSTTTLEDVIKKIIHTNGRIFSKVNIDVRSPEKIKWAMQLQETDFDFLKRKISESATLEMWFDGACLHIANITDEREEVIYLEHGIDLDNPEISLDTAPLDFKVMAYDSAHGKMREAEAIKLTSANPIINVAIQNSPYAKKEIFLPYGFDETINLNKVARKMSGQQAHALYNLAADSSNPNLKIGSHIKIQMKENFLEQEIENETFVITTINHTIDDEGVYQNSFFAVPKSIPYNLALETSSKPACGPRAAIVADNKDPLNLGRCRVMFIGDTNRAISPWLRCLTPSTQNTGLICLPKKNEQVMVFSESLNPEQSAFIMGSFWFKNQDTKKCKDPEKTFGWYFRDGGFWFDENDGSFNINANKVKIVGGKLIFEGTKEGTFINCGEK